MEYRFLCEQPVRWGDIDAAGVLNNAVYLSLLEQARYEYFRRLDLLEDGQFPFLLGETTLRFVRPGRAGMILQIAARTTRLGGKSLDMRYEVRHGGELLVEARATLVYVDPALKSRAIPEEARRRISEFEGIPERGS